MQSISYLKPTLEINIVTDENSSVARINTAEKFFVGYLMTLSVSRPYIWRPWWWERGRGEKLVEWELAGKTEVFSENSSPAPLCPSQIATCRHDGKPAPNQPPETWHGPWRSLFVLQALVSIWSPWYPSSAILMRKSNHRHTHWALLLVHADIYTWEYNWYNFNQIP
jgi:hypothetical protein